MRRPTSWSYFIPSFSLIGRKLQKLSGNKKVTDGRTDAEGNNMMQSFYKRAYRNEWRRKYVRITFYCVHVLHDEFARHYSNQNTAHAQINNVASFHFTHGFQYRRQTWFSIH